MKKIIPCFTLFLSLSLFCTTSFSAVTGNVAAEFNMVAHSFVVDRSENIIYVSLSDSNSVAVIDADKLEVIATIPVGNAPRGMALSWDNTKLYVATSGSASLDVINLATHTLLTPYPLSTTPGDVEVDARERIYVASSSSSNRYMLMVDPDTRTYQQYNCRTCYTPRFEMNPDGTILFSANMGVSPGTLEKLDVSGDGLPTQTWVNGHGDLGSNGQDLWVTPEGKHLYYAVGGGNDGYDIAQIDAKLMGINGALNTGAYPREITTSPDAKTAYAVHTSGHIDVWNAETFQLIKQYSTVGEAAELITDRSGNYLFAAFSDKLRVYAAEGSEDLCASLDCDDGLSCNGEETCKGGICLEGTPLCEEGKYCDEDSDTCVECLINANCDDGVFCNGGEACEVGVCVTAVTSCADDEFCDEELDMCYECLNDSHCGVLELCEDAMCIRAPDFSSWITVTLKGPGTMEVAYEADLRNIAGIELTDTTEDSTLTITSSLKKTPVYLGELDILGSLKAIKGKAVVLTGALTATGGIAKMQIAETEAKSSIEAAWLGNLSVSGDFAGDMKLSGTGMPPKDMTLGKASIKGTLDNAQLLMRGNVGLVKVGFWGAGSTLAVGVEAGADGRFFSEDDIATEGWLKKVKFKDLDFYNGGEDFGIIVNEFFKLKPKKRALLPLHPGDFWIMEK